MAPSEGSPGTLSTSPSSLTSSLRCRCERMRGRRVAKRGCGQAMSAGLGLLIRLRRTLSGRRVDIQCIKLWDVILSDER